MRQRAIADRVDGAGDAFRQRGNHFDRFVVELHSRGIAGDAQPVSDVARHLIAGERPEFDARGDPLVERAQRRPLQHLQQTGLAEEDQHERSAAAARQDVEMIDHVGREAMRVVDDDDRRCLERRERGRERLQRRGQRVVAAAFRARVLARDDAEVDQHPLEQIVEGEKRIADDGRHRAAIELIDHGGAQQRLSGAGRRGQDRHGVAAGDGRQQRFGRRVVGGAVIEEAQIGRGAERSIVKPVKRFVAGAVVARVHRLGGARRRGQHGKGGRPAKRTGRALVLRRREKIRQRAARTGVVLGGSDPRRVRRLHGMQFTRRRPTVLRLVDPREVLEEPGFIE